MKDIREGIKEYMLNLYDEVTFRGVIEIDESLISHRTIYYNER